MLHGNRFLLLLLRAASDPVSGLKDILGPTR